MEHAPVGREVELASLVRFVDAVPGGPVGFVIEGETGIGKTTLWKEGVSASLRRSYRLLKSRPGEADAHLPFSALGDLFGGALDEGAATLPEPQRKAVEVALLRRAARRRPSPEPRAVSLGVLGVLRSLSASAPVVVAVDDVQWLDASSARVLEFAIRRLDDEPIGVLATVRLRGHVDDPLGLEGTGLVEPPHRVNLGPLDVAAMSSLITSRLAARFSLPTLRRLHSASGGNPFFALQIARALLRRGTPLSPGEELPVPENLRELLAQQLADLPASAREVVFVVSALSKPTLSLVEAAMGEEQRAAVGLLRAIEARAVEVEGDRIRFTHPLLGSVAYSRETSARRRHLHRRLAEVVTDPEERARHLALAAKGPDAEVAFALDEAARTARARGAPDAAADLAERARNLTPPDDADAVRRRGVQAAEYHYAAGDTPQARRLLEEAVAASPPGPIRADALRRLGKVRYHDDSYVAAKELFTEALEEAGDDVGLAAIIHRDLAWAVGIGGDVRSAVEYARAGLRLGERVADPGTLAEMLATVALAEFAQGVNGSVELMERAVSLESWAHEVPIEWRPSAMFAMVLKWSDDVASARSRFELLYRRSVEHGDESSVPFLLHQLSELECWAGNWLVAERYADEAVEAAWQTGHQPMASVALYSKALVEALLGRVRAAREGAEKGRELAQRTGIIPAMLLNQSVLGFLELSLGDPAGAHGYLAPMSALVAAAGIEEPGIIRFMPDEIEALVALGALDEAEALLEQLKADATRLDRASALATAARSEALLSEARGDVDGANAALDRALHEHERVSYPFELARTLLTAGTIERRQKQKKKARASIERAVEVFARLGAELWLTKARAELARIGGRSSVPTRLTPTEWEITRLVTAGFTNREIAARLFMSVRTVEANLSRIYRKVGVGSRRELARTIDGSQIWGAAS